MSLVACPVSNLYISANNRFPAILLALPCLRHNRARYPPYPVHSRSLPTARSTSLRGTVLLDIIYSLFCFLFFIGLPL